MVLALEFWGPPFHFLMNASANLLVFVTKFGVTPQLGLQRHLASKEGPKGSQGVPKVSKRNAKSPENKQKSKRNHWKIKLSTSAKQWISKEKSKQTSKVHTKCEKKCEKKTAICQNIIAESWGGTPPQMQYFDILQFFHTFFTLCVYFWSLFRLSL